MEASNLIVYRFSELANATENFKFSKGDFAGTFKGWVDENTLVPSKVGTGMTVAVKRLNQESVEDLKQWEVVLLLQLWNIVEHLFLNYEEKETSQHILCHVSCSIVNYDSLKSYAWCRFNMPYSDF